MKHNFRANALIWFFSWVFVFYLFISVFGQVPPEEKRCITCHRTLALGIVSQWERSKHHDAGVECDVCHGSDHSSAADVNLAKMPTPQTCGNCHSAQFEGYRAGKHASAWMAMEAMPTTKDQPHPIISGQKGCGGCHKMGLREKIGDPSGKGEEYAYGLGCDACHTRHIFSKKEAQNSRACLPCHMGFDHPQWEMWSSSKHGVINLIDRNSERAPSCQTCHMHNGDHRVMTSWGFLGLRLPEEDSLWMGYRTTILKGLGVLDWQGNPTPRLDVVKAGNLARLTKEDWQKERDKMKGICRNCHSRAYVEANLTNADTSLKDADLIFSEAVGIVEGLYRDKVLPVPKDYPPHVDLLRFYDVQSSIEQDLYLMFMEYRMRTFQGAFHMNPDYMHWYGWAPLKETLVRIKDEAEKLRNRAGGK